MWACACACVFCGVLALVCVCVFACAVFARLVGVLRVVLVFLCVSVRGWVFVLAGGCGLCGLGVVCGVGGLVG